jgi:uncharacterized protein (DUF1499 family)
MDLAAVPKRERVWYQENQNQSQEVTLMNPKKILSLILCFATFGLWGCAGEQPDNLGINQGQLAPCPDSPNCVSTQAEDATHRMEPISYVGSREAAQATILEILNEMERTEVVVDDPGYLRAEARSRIFGFVDDVELYFDDENKQIHFRSAARLGRSDMGVNRQRMEQITEAFE